VSFQFFHHNNGTLKLLATIDLLHKSLKSWLSEVPVRFEDLSPASEDKSTEAQDSSKSIGFGLQIIFAHKSNQVLVCPGYLLKNNLQN